MITINKETYIPNPICCLCHRKVGNFLFDERLYERKLFVCTDCIKPLLELFYDAIIRRYDKKSKRNSKRKDN